jgi:WD40 repeat protein
MTEATTVDLKQLRRVKEVRSRDILFALALLPGGDRVLLGSSDAGLHELDLAAEKPERVPYSGEGHRSYVTGVGLLENEAVSCSYDGRLVWWDLESRTARRSVVAHEKWIRRLAVSPDRTRIVSVADDMRCRVWDSASGELVADVSDHAAMTPHHFPSMLYAVAISDDGRWVATGDRVGHVAIWDAATWTKVAEVEAPVMYTWDPKARRHSIGGIRSLAFSPDGERLAVGGTGKIGNIDHLEGRARLEVFSWRSGERLHELEDENRKGLVEQIVWLPESSIILTAGGDHRGFLTFYDLEKGERTHQDGNDSHIHAVAYRPEDAALFVAAHERVEQWTLAAAEPAEKPPEPGA